MHQLLQGDNRQVLKTLPDQSVHCIVTSPPYFGLRDYGVDGQIGLEETPEQFVAELVAVFRECWRVLRDDGTLWVNLGDSYNSGSSGGLGGSTVTGGQRNQANSNRNGRGHIDGLPSKCLMGIPWRVAFALVDDGWILRSDIIWHKLNPMPESVTDRPTKAHEYIFLLTKQAKYYYDAEAIKEPTVKGAAGSEFHTGKTGIHQLGRSSTKPRSKADSFKREGSKREQTIPGQGYGTHRPNREESSYDVGTRNRRSVWAVATQPYPGAHFATFPPKLIEPCILAGCPVGGTVLDPFNGSGTTGAVACARGRNYIGIDLSADYIELAHDRIREAIRESGQAYMQPICKPSDFEEMPLFQEASCQ
jgi:DNA modification methylase